jgi:hypothetical protein
MNNEERRIRQGETLGKGVFFVFGGNIFRGEKRRKGGSFGGLDLYF